MKEVHGVKPDLTYREALRKEKQNKGCKGSKVEGLKCVYFNARSIRNKCDELRAWIHTWNYDVMAITETWLAPGQELILNIPGFQCFKRDREGGKRGGGMALLVRDTITATERVGNVAGSSFESVWVEVRNRKGAVTLLGVCYRPPVAAEIPRRRLAGRFWKGAKITGLLSWVTLTSLILIGT